MVGMVTCNYCGGKAVFVFDNIVRCDYCGKLYSTVNGELSSVDPEKLYSIAVDMSKNQDEDVLKKAIEIFDVLGGYKDSATLANSGRRMIAQSRVQEEERRLAAERQAEQERIENEKKIFEEKQKTKIKRIIIATVSAVAIGAVVISVLSNLNKSSAYSEALELYNNGLYEEAMVVFDDLGDYSDASTYASTIDAFLIERESKYEKGISYYERGAYGECVACLADISDYLDSKSYIDKSSEAIYQQASDHFNSGNYEKAKELLVQVPEGASKYMDAELMLVDIDEIITEQTNAANYEYAVECYDNGDYETAQRVFIDLSNYEETGMYLSSIGEHFYKIAEELFDTNNYLECGNVLVKIDEQTEWDGYCKSMELYRAASELYINDVTHTAKALCRAEGQTAMEAYIESTVCSLLSVEDAGVLKEECFVEKINLAEEQPLAGNADEFWCGTSDYTDNMGNKYVNQIYCVRETRELTYALDSRYTVLSATFGLRETDNDIEDGVWIEFYGDGKKIGETIHFYAGVRPNSIELDVTGVNDLQILAKSNVKYWGAFLLTDGIFVSE